MSLDELTPEEKLVMLHEMPGAGVFADPEDDPTRLFAGVEIDGVPVDPWASVNKPCQHLSGLKTEVVTARVPTSADSPEALRWEILLKARCGECSQPMQVLRDTARVPRDPAVSFGIVFDLEATVGL